ncbi:phage antirepressor [Oceanobacillus sp. M60]
MNQLQVFENELFKVTAKIIDGEPAFDAEQVAKNLGLVSKTTKNGHVYENVRWSRVNNFLPQVAELKSGDFIPEPLVYKLAFKAANDIAEKFQDWLAIDVIPSIRKTGGYVQENRAIDFVNSWLPQLDENSKHAVASTLEQNKYLVNENQKLVTTIETQKPKVVFADAYEVSNDLITVKEMANLLKQKGLETGEIRFYTWLRDNGYVCRKAGDMYNLPTQRSLDLGILAIKKGVRTGTGGAIRQTRTTKVTGKGQIYFVNKLLPELAVI